MKHLEVLRAELERIFELEELVKLSREILGFDPEQIGGTAALGSFAGALVTHCQENDAIVALADALKAWPCAIVHACSCGRYQRT